MPNQDNQNPALNISAPTPGTETAVNAAGAAAIAFNFDLSSSAVSRGGNDLILEVDNGGTVRISDFFAVDDPAALPEFVLDDGTVIASRDLLSAYEVDVTPAADAAAPGGGLNAYNGDPGNLVGGLDGSGMLDPFFWGGATERVEEFDNGRFPGGSFSFSVSTDFAGAFGAYVYEDGRPFQHQGVDDLHAGRIDMNLSPNAGSSVGEIRFSGLPEGARLYVGDPAGGGREVTPDANGVYRFGADDFSGEGVYVIPPKDSDADMTINVSVDFTDSGRVSTVNGSFTAIVDAVADRPDYIGADGQPIDHAEHSISRTEVREDFTDGFNKQEASVSAGSGEGKVSVTLSVSSVFYDFDGSETHYVLVELPEGFSAPAGYQIYVDESDGGRQYLMLPADGSVDPATGRATVSVTLETPSQDADTTISLKTGAMAVENPTDADFDDSNNVSVVIDPNAVDFPLDVVDSALSISLGWASEGGDNAGHLAPGQDYNPDFGGMNDVYGHSGSDEGATGLDSSSTAEGLGAPIVIELGTAGSGTANSIDQIVLTLEPGRGSLVDGNGTVIEPDTPGGNTYTFNGPLVNGDVYFQPAAGSFEHGDVTLGYQVTVSNGQGASATYTGTGSVVVDAVADFAPISGLTPDYGSDAYGAMSAAKPGGEVELKLSAHFPDSTGGENHYVLVQAGAQGVAAYGQCVISLPDGTEVGTYDLSGLTIVDGYYQVPVPNSFGGQELHDVQASVKVEVEDSFKVDTEIPLSLGSKTEVVEPADAANKEYDGGNNSSVNVGEVKISVAPANSDESLGTVDTYETDAAGNILPNKHGVTGTLTVNDGTDTIVGGKVSGYDLNKLGDVTFALDGGKSAEGNSAADSAELFTRLEFTVEGELDADRMTELGQISLKGGGDLEISYSYDQASNTTTVIITDPTPSESSVTVNFKPGSFSDTDLKILSYELDYINSKSHDAGETIKVSGSAAQPAATVIVDAVAAKATGLGTDAPEYHEGQSQAKPGEALTVGFKMTVPELADADESHALTLKLGGNDGYNSVTLNGGSGGPLVIAFDAPDPAVAGRPALNVTVNGAASSEFSVNVITIKGAKYYKISGPGFESYLDEVGGQVSGEISFNASGNAAGNGKDLGGGDYSSGSSVGMLITDTESDGGTASKNNVSYTEQNYTYQVGAVGSGVILSVGQAYENASKDAHLEFVSRAELLADLNGGDPAAAEAALNHLKAGSAAITVSGVIDGESISRAVFVADYPGDAPGAAAAPGQFMYKGVLVELPAVGGETNLSIDGQAVTCKVDADGRVTISIENYEPLDGNGDPNLYFVPGENYNHNDVSIDYGVTVTDDASGQDKVFASDHDNPALFPADTSGLVPGTDYDPAPGEGGSVAVDAVAQRPDINGVSVVTLENAAENTIPHGGTAAILVNVDLHGDLDGTEGHVFYVKTEGNDYPLQSIVIEYIGVDGKTHSFTVDAADIGLQQTNLGGAGTSANYHTVNLGEVIAKWAGSDQGKQMVDGEVNVTVNVGTPGAGEGSTVNVGVSSHEDWYQVQQDWAGGKDTELSPSNNNAWSAGSVDIHLSSATRPGFSFDKPAFYENNNSAANEGGFSLGAGIPLSFSFGDGNDELTGFEVSLKGDNAELGDLILFNSPADYQAFEAAVNAANDPGSSDYGKSAHDILAEFIPGRAANLGDKIELGDISGLLGSNAKGETVFEGKIVFMPSDDSFSGQDPQVDCTIVVRDEASGQYASNGGYKGGDPDAAAQSGGSGNVIADAVAQQPDAPGLDNDSGGQLKPGEARNVTINARFGDMDSSTEHYILVEARAGWTLSVNGVVLGLSGLETYTEGGTVYYKIPVTPERDSLDPASPDYHSGSASLDVTLTAPTNNLYYREGTGYDFEVRAGSTDRDLSGGELTFHNNTAVSESAGGLSGNVELGHGPGEYYLEQTSALYEDNNPDSHLAGDDPNADPVGGGFTLVGAPDCAGGYALIECEVVNGEPIFNIEGAHWNGTAWEVQLDGSGNARIDVTLSEAYLAAHGGQSDADLRFDKITFHDSDGNLKGTVESAGGRLDVVVDAVADRAELGEESVKALDPDTGENRLDDAVVGGQDDLTAKFTVNATFPDVDGSETHYVLVEMIPAWEPVGAVGEVHINGKTYYKIDVTDAVNQDGTLSYEVEMKYVGAKVDIFGQETDGVTVYDLNYGTMSQENALSGLESDLQNNTAVNLEGEVTLKYSPVSSSVNMSVSSTSTTEGVGNTITLELNQIDTAGTQDVLVDLSISYTPADGSAGTLYLVDPNNPDAKVEITLGPDGSYAFSPAELANLSTGGYQLVFEQNDYNHQDVGFSWSGTVKDLVSGATETKTGGASVIMDAAAQASTNDYANNSDGSVEVAGRTEDGELSGAAGVVSGNSAVVTIKASFPDTRNVDDPSTPQVEGSEEHWVVLEQGDLDYSVTRAVIYDKDGAVINANAPVETKFGPDGTPYFAVQVPGGEEVSVAFEVSTPGGLSADTQISLNGGTIAIENTKDGSGNRETSYDNNWTANIGKDAVQIQVGVLETENVTVSAETDISEGDYSRLSFAGIDPAYNEEAVVTITGLSNGAKLFYHDGNGYVEVTDSPLTISYHNDGQGNMVPDKEYYVKADDHYSGEVVIRYESTVTDLRTGESVTLPEQSASLNIKGVATEGALDNAPQEGYQAVPDGSDAHAASARITASFADSDGSEKHYLLFRVPDGLAVDGASPVAAAVIAALGLPAGDGYYYLDVTGSNGAVDLNVGFNAVSGYNPALDTVTVWAMSEEQGTNVAEGGKYAVSEGSSVNIGDLNGAVALGDPHQGTLNLNADWTACGQMDFAEMFHDPDGDALSYSFNYKGESYVLDPDKGADIPGEYGTLHVAHDGTYTYAPNPGQPIDSSHLEDFSGLTVTADDGYGSSNTNDVDISFDMPFDTIYGSSGDDTISAGAGGMTIYGGAGDDTIYGGTGADVIHAGSGNNVIYGGLGDDVIYSGSGEDVFAWRSGDLEAGGHDTIVNFDMDNDQLFIEGLLSTGTAGEQESELAGLLDQGDLLLTLNGNSSVTLQYEGQQVEVQFNGALDDGLYNAMSSPDPAEAEAAKVSLLMNILNSSI